jgi:hypothetical protein
MSVKKPGASSFVRYYEAELEDNKLGNVLNATNGFNVFFGDFAYRITNKTDVRFHWDRLAINTAGGGTGGSTSTPTSTPTQSTRPTRTPTPTATPNSCTN